MRWMNMRKYITPGLLAILLLGILFTAGCGLGVARVGPITREEFDQVEVGAALPTEDVESGTEPLTRYPGLVMLSHLEMSLPDETGYSIQYATRDDADTVADWYKAQLVSEGWAKVADLITEGTTMLVYNKGTEDISVTISPETFTMVSILYSIDV